MGEMNVENIQVGSTILGLDNCRDTDILLIDSPRRGSWFKDGINFHPVDNERLKAEMAFDTDRYWDQFYAYMLDSDINPNNLDYNVFDYKDKLFSCIKNFNFDKLHIVPFDYRPNGVMSKRLYHIAYNAFMLQNDSKILLPEQKVIVQKIHDHEMPLTYERELENLIKNL